MVRRLAGHADLTLIVDEPGAADAVELGRSGLPGDRPTGGPRGRSHRGDPFCRGLGPPTGDRRTPAAGVAVAGLLAIWSAEHPDARTIGITGTKGKSTTSALCTALLTVAGVDVSFGGNIGVPIIDLPDRADVHVIEVSSYQAADVRRSPTIGVLTSLDADHLPWHGGLQAYWRDKLNLFEHDGLRHFVTHAELLDEHPAVAQASARRRAAGSDVTITEGELVVDGFPPLTLTDFVSPNAATSPWRSGRRGSSATRSTTRRCAR